MVRVPPLGTPYTLSRAVVFDRNINASVAVPRGVKLLASQQDRDMLARTLLVTFKISQSRDNASASWNLGYIPTRATTAIDSPSHIFHQRLRLEETDPVGRPSRKHSP